jgi:hypothetical protein
MAEGRQRVFANEGMRIALGGGAVPGEGHAEIRIHAGAAAVVAAEEHPQFQSGIGR